MKEPIDDPKTYLEELIAKDRPDIRMASNELERLHIIREWVFTNTMLAGTTEYKGDPFSKDKAEAGTIEYYDNMYNEVWKKEGYYCGGIAQYLSDIYMTLGYNSLFLSAAVLDNEGNIVDSHAITLVRYKEKWIVEDATFNISYADESGNILDIREIRKRVEEKKEIQIIRGNAETKLYISSLSEYHGIYDCLDSYELNGTYFYVVKMDADRFLESRKQDLKPIFEEDNITYTPEGLLYYCYSIYESHASYVNILLNDLEIRK